MNSSRPQHSEGAANAYAFRKSQQRNRGKLYAFVPLAFALYVITGLAFEALIRTWLVAGFGAMEAWGIGMFETLFVFVDANMREKYNVASPSLMSPLSVLIYWKSTVHALVTFNTIPWFSAGIVALMCRKTWLRWNDPLAYFSQGLELVTADLERRDHVQLSNALEEVVLAMGLKDRPVLRIALSAAPFAYSVETLDHHSAIVVSQGLVSNLDRNEMRAVLAHEAAHLQADDHKLNFFISMSTYWWGPSALDELYKRAVNVRDDSVLFARGDSLERTVVMLFFGLFWVLLVVLVTLLSLTAVLGFFALKLLGKSFLSRRRDFMADAAVVDALRDHESLGRALLKHWICYHEKGIPIDEGEAVRINHLFVNPYQLDLRHSHGWHPQPSIAERLEAIGIGHTTYAALEEWQPNLTTSLHKKQRLKWW